MSKKSAFSLVEIIVSAVIFTLTVAGVFSAIRSLAKHPVSQSAKDVMAVQYGQRFLDSLRMEVISNNWVTPSGKLAPVTNAPMDVYATEFPGFTGFYNVIDQNGARSVTLNIIPPP